MAAEISETKENGGKGAAFMTAFREARHIAGGLVHHPAESTKHYSVLRHSIGLVYYKGPSTSLAVTVFSSLNHPLPTDRTLWLQPKGWLGKTGWRAKSLIGLEGDWLNVTPATRAATEQLNPDDERAWQRDIKHFTQRSTSGPAKKHVVRETDIIRIPVEATDGYFRVVLCTGPQGKRKTLCPSPEFRVASTSASPSSVRGASLGTLPLELGAKALSTFTSGQVGAVTAPVTDMVQPYVEQVQQQVQPGFLAQEALTEGYSRSGLEDRVTAAGDAYTTARDTSYEPLAGPPCKDADSAGRPQAPYPIHISSQVVPGTGFSTATTSLPTANLKTLRDDLAHRMIGYYFGYAHVLKPVGNEQQTRLVTALDTRWYEAIISVLPRQTSKSISVIHGVIKTAAVHIIHDFGRGADLVGATLEVLVLGFLHPPLEVPTPISTQPQTSEETKEAALLAAVDDVALTQASLSRPGWNISDILDPRTGKFRSAAQRAQTMSAAQEPGGAQQQQLKLRAATITSGLNQGFNETSNRVTDTYVNTRQGVQRQIDRVPLHLAGIRVGVDGLRDKSIGQGGVYVVRG